ncbi:MAG TPA: cation:dicarboxylase symporter family transporter, partial [Nitrospiraceae bacterium]|nr:cation:dicarboxylase symporter family transporter [Nitrospiraceae bacterium]
MTQRPPGEPRRSLWASWHGTPLYLRIIGGLVLGVLVGVVFGENAQSLALPSQLILRVLGALAPPLILVAVIHVLMHADIRGRLATRMVGLLVLNTLVAISLGLLVANVLRPGERANLTPAGGYKASELPHDPEARAILQALEKEGYTLPEKAKGQASQVSQFLDS